MRHAFLEKRNVINYLKNKTLDQMERILGIVLEEQFPTAFITNLGELSVLWKVVLFRGNFFLFQ